MDASLRTRAEQLASEIAGQAETADDLNSLMRVMMKSTMERMLDTEMDVHLGRRSLGTAAAEPVSEARAASEPVAPPASRTKRAPNRRNGRSGKTVRGEMGELTISTPRDRDSTFEPQLIASTNGVCRASTRRSSRSMPRG